MTVYAVFLNEPDKEAWQALAEKWPERHHFLTDNMAFVAPEALTLTSDVVKVAGIGGDRKIPGIVFELGAHARSAKGAGRWT